MNKNIYFLIGLLLATVSSLAQFTINGKIIDQETKLPVGNVNIQIKGMSGGSISASDGNFHLESSKQTVVLLFTSIGYKPLSLKTILDEGSNNLGLILLEQHPYPLDEITINAGLSEDKELPISISSVSSKSIENKLGDRPLPQIMENVPGVFSTRNGGGSGDARLSIRGFQQENISLLLNGIPINGQENGLVYWSNWLGLANAAAEIQIQKGPGLANASVNSVGATVNIITRNSNKPKGGSVGFEISSYGNMNTTIALNSGKLKSGWNTSLMLGFGSGPGYVDATQFKSFSYFFSTNKDFGKHKLAITLIGAPQRHEQRTLKLSEEEVIKNGLKFNKDWGGFNGQKKNASQNFYHKPFLSINHNYKINQKNKISTAAYFTVGSGGGQWSESFNYAPSIFSYRDHAGQIEWESIYSNNATHQGTHTLENGETVSGYSLNVQTNFLASHLQTGIMSNYEHNFNQNLSLKAGLHYRYFNSFLREEIDDLLGGDFFIEDYGWSLAGVAGRNQIKTVGDIIRVDNSSIINFASAYTQLLYNSNSINAYFSANANNNWYQRDDRFNYITNTKSETVVKPGFDLRAGFLYKIKKRQQIFVNAAYISRAPYFKYVFGNFTNVVVKDLKNENIKTIELGYKLKSGIISTQLSAYLSSRNNVSMLSNEYVQLEDNTQTRAMVNGLNSIHKGIELDFAVELTENIKLGGWLSLGDFKWENNVSATLFNDNNVAVDTVNVFVEGLNIGGTAQQQFGGFVDFRLLESIFVKVEYLYFNRLFADFDPTNRSNPEDRQQAFQLPSYGLANAYIGIPFKIGDQFCRVQLNVYNVLNKTYIVNGEDGIDHNLESFKGFWSFGRNLSIGFRLNF